MSYDILRSFSVDTKTRSFRMQVADSSIRPLIFSKVEWLHLSDEEFRQKAKILSDGLLDGCIKAYKGIRLYNIQEKMTLFRQIADVSWDIDCKYKTSLYNDFRELISEVYGIKAILKEPVDESNIGKKCRDFKEYAKTELSKAAKEYAAAGKIPICSAICSPVFEDWDLLCSYDNKDILAPRKNYDNRGTLENKDNSAIILGPDSSIMWRLLAYPVDMELQSYIALIAAQSDISVSFISKWFAYCTKVIGEKCAGMTMTKLPYKDFPYDDYGITYAPSGGVIAC